MWASSEFIDHAQVLLREFASLQETIIEIFESVHRHFAGNAPLYSVITDDT